MMLHNVVPALPFHNGGIITLKKFKLYNYGILAVGIIISLITLRIRTQNKRRKRAVYKALSAMESPNALADIAGFHNEGSDVKYLRQFSVFIGERVFQCDVSLLKQKCDFFRALFSFGWKEIIEGKVDLRGVSAEIFVDILQWMKHGSTAITDQNIRDLLVAADRLEIKGLIPPCKQFLCETEMSGENCTDRLEINQRFKIEGLFGKSWPYMLNNFDDLCQTEAFYSLSLEDFRRLVENPELVSASEDFIVEVSLMWVRFENEFETVDLSENSSDMYGNGDGFNSMGSQLHPNRVQYLSILLKACRYLLISPDCVSQTLARDPVIRADPDCRNILKEIARHSKWLDSHQHCVRTAEIHRLSSEFRDVILTFYDGAFYAHDLTASTKLGLKVPTQNIHSVVYYDMSIYVRGEDNALYVLPSDSTKWNKLTASSEWGITTVAMVPIEKDLVSVYTRDNQVYSIERCPLRNHEHAQWTPVGELTVKGRNVISVTNIGPLLIMFWAGTERQGPSVECYHLVHGNSSLLKEKFSGDRFLVAFKHADEGVFVLQDGGDLWRISSLEGPPYISVSRVLSLWTDKLRVDGAMIIEGCLWVFVPSEWYSDVPSCPATVNVRAHLDNVFSGVHVCTNSAPSHSRYIHAVVHKKLLM